MQDDADVDPSHTGTTAHLFPGQGESGESYPTQAPLSTGLWRKRLSLRGTRVLEAESASYSRHFLLLVRVFGNLTHNFVLCVF